MLMNSNNFLFSMISLKIFVENKWEEKFKLFWNLISYFRENAEFLLNNTKIILFHKATIFLSTGGLIL